MIITSTALPVRLFLVPIILADCPSCPVSTALVDSGAAGNFMDQTLVSSLNITTYPLSSPFPVQGLDCQPLGSGTIPHITQPLTLTMEPNHQENIPFFIAILASAP